MPRLDDSCALYGAWRDVIESRVVPTPSPSPINYIPALLPIATFFLSVAVVVIAGQQWRVARNKLRLDLYDRRYKVWDTTRTFLLKVLNDTVTDPTMTELKLAIADAEFLFDDEVVQFLKRILKRAAGLWTTRTLLKDTRRLGDEELSRLATAQENDLLWLGDQITEATKVFGRYIGFAHVK
jgi:hypothetical protein